MVPFFAKRIASPISALQAMPKAAQPKVLWSPSSLTCSNIKSERQMNRAPGPPVGGKEVFMYPFVTKYSRPTSRPQEPKANHPAFPAFILHPSALSPQPSALSPQPSALSLQKVCYTPHPPPLCSATNVQQLRDAPFPDADAGNGKGLWG